MKLNGKQSTNTLNNWLPNWLQPLVDERTTETNLNSNESSNMNDTNDNTRNNDDQIHSTTTTIRNITPTIQQEKPPAPPRFNEPYFNINEYKNPSKFTYFIYLIVIYIHLPVSIFFDANTIYVLTNLLEFNNWIWALVVYCVSLAAMWFIVLVSDIHSYRLFWNLRRPPIYKAYTTPKLFNLTCSKSLQHFRLLFSIRKLAYQSSIRDFFLEYTHHLHKNYPIILTCVPRAAISLAVILQFWNPSFLPIIENAFFEKDAQLSRYAQGVLITHVVWVGFRLLVIVMAFISHYLLSSSMFGTPLPYDDKEALNYAQENNHSWAWKERMVHRIEEIFRRGINPSAQEKRFSWSIRERPTTWTPNQVRLQDRQRLRRCSSNSDSVIVTSRSAPVVRITEHSLVPTPIMTDDRRGSVATRSNSLNTVQRQETQSDLTSGQSQDESQESSQETRENSSSSHEQSPTQSIGLFSNASWHTPEREPTVASHHSRSNGTSPRVGPARESTTSMSSVGALVNNNNGNSLPRDESYGSLPVPPLPASTSAEPALTQEGSSGSQSNGNDNSNTNHSRHSSYERDLIASESRDALGPIQSTSRMLDDFSYTPEREVQPSSNSNNSGSSSDLSNHSNNSHSSSSLSRMSSFFARKLKKKRSSSQTVLAQSREPGEGNQYNVNEDGVETENVSPPPPYTPTVSHSESRETIEQTSNSPEVEQRRQSRQSRQSQRSSAIPIGLGLREEEDDADDENDSSNNNSDGIDWNTLRVESKRRLQDEQEQQSERRYEQ